MNNIKEPIVEDATLSWLRELGYAIDYYQQIATLRNTLLSGAPCIGGIEYVVEEIFV